ncbi:MAG: hypothetical protein HPY70_12870 [Firmicutes bacterium]|nr:hypothetical protein [Bacillota bacterium]
MEHLKASAIIILIILAILMSYSFIASEEVLYDYSKVIGLDNYIAKPKAISKLEVVEHKDISYSYTFITNQDELNKLLNVYKKIDFNEYNFLFVYIHKTPSYGYRSTVKTYRIIRKFDRIYLDLYGDTTSKVYPRGDRCFGILIPKSDSELAQYIKSGKRIYVYR